MEIKTIGELKKLIANLSDDTKVCRLTNGHYNVYKNDCYISIISTENNSEWDDIDCKEIFLLI